MARQQKTTKRQKPKTILRFPDLEHSKNAVVNSLAATSSKESYTIALARLPGMKASHPFSRQVRFRVRRGNRFRHPPS